MSTEKTPYAADLAPSEPSGSRGASPAAYGTASGDTFPRLLAGLAAQRPNDTALQEKRYGIWQPLTWAQYNKRVRDFAHGLAALGVERGQIVAVLGDNRPEWLIAELAAQSLGASVVGVYPTSIGEELHHILTHSRARVVIAEDQEQVDKLIRLRSEAADLPMETVVYYDPHGLEAYTDEFLTDFTAVEAQGREWGDEHPGWLDEQIASGRPEDVAVICTTSGTTSRPKLAELSHANLLAMAEHLTTIDPIGARDRYVSFLPFAWIGEQMLAVACGLSRGLTLSFPEDSATQKTDLREIGPNVMFSPPRIWESMLSEVQVRIDEAGWLKRKVFGWGYAIGDRVAEQRIHGKAKAIDPLYWLADQVALRPVRDQLGLARIDHAYTGGAPLGPDVFRFFHAIGVNLKQIYGQTEICGIAVVHRDDDIAFASVGTPIPGTEIRITDEGEILLRSASVFRGYHRNPEATAEAVDADGWLHTGDAGFLDEQGHLVVIDRAKDVLTTSDGTRFSSAFIENKLKFSPYVEEAVTFPTDHGMTAMITIDPMTTGSWAEHERLSYTTYTDLAGKQEVRDLIAEEVLRANEDLPESIRIKRFVLLHKQFDPDDDEITRTRKVRRNVIAERYADIINGLAGGSDDVTIRSLVTYQDGSQVERNLVLKIVDMSTFRAPEGRGRRPVWSGRR
ncbi:AMP-binding protein [Intrasporangium calvum]|uniref:Acyl-CoA synthetase n=1 Tax=Intrasporangium calvum (strain ATCC 23552 / DSM 43043 / JCM 3097 / NBRC 12989 / NCIMB 10167 / NRRL B-3866 / 7 KIP) TaxID=710696 RepID=E6S7L7_INTC7|nr:AMP-binding protein [Intrasporangium calvum]ADU46912.1 AMP-dependent synthetase and ligase [Intrasporangium calvum DSM 43043]